MDYRIIGERIRPRIEGLYAPFGGVIRLNQFMGVMIPREITQLLSD